MDVTDNLRCRICNRELPQEVIDLHEENCNRAIRGGYEPKPRRI